MRVVVVVAVAGHDVCVTSGGAKSRTSCEGARKTSGRGFAVGAWGRAQSMGRYLGVVLPALCASAPV